MHRAAHLLVAAGLLAQGCIIYEEHWVTESCEDCGTTWTWTDTETTDTTTETTDPGPTLTSELELTVSSGLPGESLLSSLISVGAFDLSSVQEVGFGRDVSVLDVLERDDELVLLLNVASDAVPGDVQVFVTTTDGQGWLLEQPFTIEDPGTTTDTGGTTSGTTDTGTTGTTDTGCP
ncbi:MAG: hypothetical protein H6738_16740 [Alphaproteobacteria bacterium]|nr:hypothetical protein [Alphaproteobacteria bacterium]MCB9698430.1 hypothetical protein [Alphaproteobacteria bacterium]